MIKDTLRGRFMSPLPKSCKNHAALSWKWIIIAGHNLTKYWLLRCVQNCAICIKINIRAKLFFTKFNLWPSSGFFLYYIHVFIPFRVWYGLPKSRGGQGDLSGPFSSGNNIFEGLLRPGYIVRLHSILPTSQPVLQLVWFTRLNLNGNMQITLD